MRAALLTAAALMLAGPAFAQDDAYCGPFGAESLEPGLAQVAKGDDGQRLHFSNDGNGRPCAQPRCRAKAFVVVDDEVVVDRFQGDYACVWYKPKGRTISFGTTGWVRSDALKSVRFTTQPSAAEWAGDWVLEQRWGLETNLVIASAGPGKLKIKGDSFYASSREAIERGGVNIGEVDTVLTPKGWRAGLAVPGPDGRLPSRDAKAADYDCRIGLTLVGPWLLVVDNNACGGMNVSFTGLYRRRG